MAEQPTTDKHNIHANDKILSITKGANKHNPLVFFMHNTEVLCTYWLDIKNMNVLQNMNRFLNEHGWNNEYAMLKAYKQYYDEQQKEIKVHLVLAKNGKVFDKSIQQSTAIEFTGTSVFSLLYPLDDTVKEQGIKFV